MVSMSRLWFPDLQSCGQILIAKSFYSTKPLQGLHPWLYGGEFGKRGESPWQVQILGLVYSYFIIIINYSICSPRIDSIVIQWVFTFGSGTWVCTTEQPWNAGFSFTWKYSLQTVDCQLCQSPRRQAVHAAWFPKEPGIGSLDSSQDPKSIQVSKTTLIMQLWRVMEVHPPTILCFYLPVHK